tara:strand:- start:543 stop:827 length:285 start_codon:yes stop_codon:yes gene_type:complete
MDSMKPITISYYSHSKDEYVPIDDMHHEHLVNVIYKSVLKSGRYLANFRVRINGTGAFDDATMSLGINPSFMELVETLGSTVSHSQEDVVSSVT